uniref:Integrase catalytic domain-containing protein n=1 Tax=Steinernema glaseri TaxID=37863 RepID=A0A1I8AFR5_9BILA
MDAHQKVLHRGSQQTLATLRDTYWIQKDGKLVQSVIAACPHCRRFRSTPYKLPPFPPLPTERVSRASAFEHIGLDYFGPLKIKQAKNNGKMWVIMITCMSTRAIHLEMVFDMTTLSFLSAFRRFISRRGCPRSILSDNAAQLKLASKTMADIFTDVINDPEVTTYCTSKRIQWNFTTEHAPWQGGMYERMIGLVKETMRSAIGRKFLSPDEYHTTLLEVEAAVNSRPLTYQHGDEDSRAVLRPVDFLNPGAKIGLPTHRSASDDGDPDYIPPGAESREQLLQIYDQTTAKLDRAWDYFREHYLKSLRMRAQLIHRGSKHHEHAIPRVGEVVIVQDDNLPRGEWKVARVTEVVKSQDHEIRTAKIRLPSSRIVARPLNQLYPLETSTPTEDPPEVNETKETTTTTVTATATTSKAFPFYLQTLILLSLSLLASCSSSGGTRCAEELAKNWTLIRSHQKCLTEGIAVYQTPSGKYCYHTINCGDGQHLQPPSSGIICGPPCKCPPNSSGCSFYDGIKTAESKSKKSLNSLNDCLYRGPNRLPDLAAILVRTRLPAISIWSDLEKAFLKLSLAPQDRNVTRFFWVKDAEKPPTKDNIVVYRFLKVLFGLKCSPALLNMTVQHHLQRAQSEIASDILKNTYVDDVYQSADTVAMGIQKFHEAKELFQAAGMNLRDFKSNSIDLNSYFVAQGEKPTPDVVKILGIWWNLVNDTYELTIPVPPDCDQWSKLTVLSALNAVFEPFGLISPALLRGKLFLQTLWKKKLSWKTPLSPELKEEFEDIVAEWRDFPVFSIPRRLSSREGAATYEMHTFVDASAYAYSSITYIRVLSQSGVELVPVFAKSRVGPNPPVTIPRMELIAMVIGVKTTQFLQRELGLPIEAVVLWSDSTATLGWVKSGNDQEVFVQNRVKKIRTLDCEFRHVPTADNPADIGSRGLPAKELAQSSLWWKGPTWLEQDRERWPSTICFSTGDIEQRSEETITSTITEPPTVVSSEWLF